MTVRVLLRSIDSQEIAEWQAYEKAFGPLGAMYTQELLAKQVDQQQLQNYLAGAQFDENPVPEPVKTLRPNEVYLPEFLEPEDPEEDEELIEDPDVIARLFDN